QAHDPQLATYDPGTYDLVRKPQSPVPYIEDSSGAKHKNNQAHDPQLATYDPGTYDLVTKQHSANMQWVLVVIFAAWFLLAFLPPAFSLVIILVATVSVIIYSVSRVARSR